MSRMSEIDIDAQTKPRPMTRKDAVANIAERISEIDPETSAVAATASAMLAVGAMCVHGVAPEAVANALAAFVLAYPAGGLEVR